MSNDKISIKTFLALPLAEQVGGDGGGCGAWYDWFCTDRALFYRGKSLVAKLKSIQHTTKFNIETSYVFFKNNCPCSGDLYDDLRICDIKSGDLIFTIVPKEGYAKSDGLGCVWGKMPEGSDKEFGEVFRGDWKAIKEWFNKE